MKALEHSYPQWEHDRDSGEDILAWGGHMRIVHNRKRACRLKRRGVPMMHIGMGDGTPAQQPRKPGGALEAFGPWAWFETFENREARMQARHERAQARFAKRYFAQLEASMAAWVAQDPWSRQAVTFMRTPERVPLLQLLKATP